MTEAERRLWRLVAFWSSTFLIEVVIYCLWAWHGPPESRGFAVNSIAKDMTFLVIGLLILVDLRRFGALVWLLVVGHLFIVVSLLVLWISGKTPTTFPGVPAGVDPLGLVSWLSRRLQSIGLDDRWRLPLWAVFAPTVPFSLWRARIRATKSRTFRPTFLLAHQFSTLAAIAEAAIAAPRRVTPFAIAEWMDDYWAVFKGESTVRARFALSVVWASSLFKAPNGFLRRRPFTSLDLERRRKFLADYLHHALPKPTGPPTYLRLLAQSCIRFGVQMVNMSYYSHRETDQDTGFRQLRKRPPYADGPPTPTPPGALPQPPPELETLDPEAGAVPASCDVLIIGSGAGGAIVADRLVRQGRSVLIVERGDHVSPQDFVEDELAMYGKLYSDGALQQSRDFRTQLLQGMCVGGSTVVNNAVCFRLPDATRDDWAAKYGLPAAELDAAFAAVEQLIGVQLQAGVAESDGVASIVRAAAGMAEGPFEYVKANIGACVGCGCCNIGCAYGRKLSMLDLVLPQAQRLPGRLLQILPRTEAVAIEVVQGNGAAPHARAVTCRVGRDRRKVTIKAQTVVVAAGAIHSSRLLKDSGIRVEQAGSNLCANLASPMTGEFPTPQNAFAGLQMTRYLDGPPKPDAAAVARYVLEPDFNPVVTQALAMPGWLDRHRANMNNYSKMMCIGVVVPTAPDSENLVTPSPSRFLPRTLHVLADAEFDLQPSDEELRYLVEGLKHAGRILFEAGATRVMPATFGYRVCHSKDELDKLDDLLTLRHELNLQTAHPQGGNPIGPADRAVVDTKLRVHGFENLYVCDASVFPEAIGVNPQLTVMALAHYAATVTGGMIAHPPPAP